MDGRNLDFGTERRLGERDRHLHRDMLIDPFENLVTTDTDDDVQVPGWSPIKTRTAFSGHPNLLAVVNPSWNFHFDALRLLDVA